MTWSATLARWLSATNAGRAVDSYSPPSAPSSRSASRATPGFQVARPGIGEADFWVQFDPGGNPHALGGSPPVRMILTVDRDELRRVVAGWVAGRRGRCLATAEKEPVPLLPQLVDRAAATPRGIRIGRWGLCPCVRVAPSDHGVYRP